MDKTRQSANLASENNIFSDITNNRVGIATTIPQYTLDVRGDINFSGSLNQGGSSFVASRWTAGTGNDIYRLNGDVGIGTTNPGATLQVTPTSTSIAGLFSGTTSSDMVRITQTGTGNALVVEDETNPDASAFVVTGIGSVGIGTTNPQTKLSIIGVLGFNGSNVRIGGNTTGASITSGTNNNFIGVGAGYITNTGSSNNFIGINAGFSNQNGSSNNFLGSGSGYTNTSGTGNNFFGLNAGFSNQSGSSNNFFGVAAGISNQTGSNNIFLGARNGISASASYKVIIGSGYLSNYFDSPSTTKDYQFAVGIRTDANASKYWLVGDENFNVGIGTTNPTSKLQVVGDALVSGIVTATSYRGDGSQLSGISVGTDITSSLFT